MASNKPKKTTLQDSQKGKKGMGGQTSILNFFKTRSRTDDTNQEATEPSEPYCSGKSHLQMKPDNDIAVSDEDEEDTLEYEPYAEDSHSEEETHKTGKGSKLDSDMGCVESKPQDHKKNSEDISIKEKKHKPTGKHQKINRNSDHDNKRDDRENEESEEMEGMAEIEDDAMDTDGGEGQQSPKKTRKLNGEGNLKKDAKKKKDFANASSNVLKKRKKPVRMWKQMSDRDTEDYRKGYPGKRDNENLKENLLFYTNKRKSEPTGDYIDEIHKQWYGNWELLERHHGYIQWLFPIRESGMNWQAQELQIFEAEAIKKDPEAQQRVIKSYEMMLDFYGMDLEDKKTGKISRAEHWKERFRHLNRSMHNYLRITRILKSLGELGFEHLKSPFVHFVLEEALEKQTLTNCIDSCLNYWLQTIRDESERKDLNSYADSFFSD